MEMGPSSSSEESGEGEVESCQHSDASSRAGGSIAERRAARCGFKRPPRVNTARFRCVSPPSSPSTARSPYVTIPPGLSPTVLLDSPLMHPEFQIQMGCDDDRFGFLKQEMKGYADDIESSEDSTEEGKGADEQTCQLNDQAYHFKLKGEDMVSQPVLEGDRTRGIPTSSVGRPLEDGYNWRKYGQKHVKGSEYPRSYYKCTHPSCQVKKKVERSLDGQITEIIYKGSHHHPMPQPTRRSTFGSSPDPAIGPPGSYSNADGESTGSSQHGPNGNSSGDWSADGLERTPSLPAAAEVSDQLSTSEGKQSSLLTDYPDLPWAIASQNDDEDGATQRSLMIEDDGEYETVPKRRKKEIPLVENNPAFRAVREPRVVIQTVSEVDILNDGYRWRKYGQKVVKGNPNPRSYYKCTSPGCPVRKHVERASHDLESVVTTYEGKHNHQVPMARNNNHNSSASSSDISSVGGSLTSSVGSSQSSMVPPRSIGIPKTEPQDRDLVPRFDRRLELGGSNYLNPYSIGSLAPGCEMKLPEIQPIPFSSFGLSAGGIEAHHASILRDMANPFPVLLQRQHLAVSGYDYLPQQSRDSGTRFLRRPKQEIESVYDLHANTLYDARASFYGQSKGMYLAH